MKKKKKNETGKENKRNDVVFGLLVHRGNPVNMLMAMYASLLGLTLLPN